MVEQAEPKFVVSQFAKARMAHSGRLATAKHAAEQKTMLPKRCKKRLKGHSNSYVVCDEGRTGISRPTPAFAHVSCCSSTSKVV